MATFYIDPISGNDGNAGTSTGAAWKTITNGPTAARVAPGDFIKVKKSTETTIANTTWTFNSSSVTLPASTIQTIDDGIGNAWTSSANVTGGTSTTRKIGATAQQFTIAAGFTTGKIAYKATGTLDLSAYTKVSFWIRTSVAASANTYTLRLCSDTTGDTAVHTITIPAMSGNVFYPVTWDNGGALSSSIQSVALYATVDPATPMLLIQNIFATNNISLTTVIGPTAATAFHPIAAITGTTVSIDTADTTASGYIPWIDGTTGTYTTTCIDGYQADLINGNATDTFQLNESGTAALGVTLSGGWDFGTNTQTGYTHYTRYLGGTGSFYNLNYEYFILSRSKSAISLPATAHARFSNMIFSGSSISVLTLTDGAGFVEYPNMQFYNIATPLNINSAGSTLRIFRKATFYNISTGLFNTQSGSLMFYNSKFVNGVNTSNPTAPVQFINCVFTSFNFPSLTTAANFNQWSYANCTGSSMPVTTTALVLGTEFRAYWQTTTKQGSDPGAWRLDTASTNRAIGTPNVFKIGEIFCSVANSLVTVSAWMKKDSSTGVGVSLGVFSDELTGVNETFSTKADNASWEQVSISFTPTQVGVISIYAKYWYVSVASNVYIGSLTVTQ